MASHGAQQSAGTAAATTAATGRHNRQIGATVHLRRCRLAASLGQHLHTVRVQLGNGGHQIVDGLFASLVNGVAEVLGILRERT